MPTNRIIAARLGTSSLFDEDEQTVYDDYEFQERAAFLEFDAGFTRGMAEYYAAEELTLIYQKKGLTWKKKVR